MSDFSWLNWVIIKSEFFSLFRNLRVGSTSLTPQSAAMSIGVSLYPSPTASIFLLSLFLAISVIWAFYAGDSLANITDLDLRMMFNSMFSVSIEVHAKVNEVPSIATRSAPSVWNCFASSSLYWRSSNCFSAKVSVTDNLSIKLQACAMHFVVSTLSPVRIHTFTPALLMYLRVCGTSFYN